MTPGKLQQLWLLIYSAERDQIASEINPPDL
jgi:hypothetical protein